MSTFLILATIGVLGVGGTAAATHFFSRPPVDEAQIEETNEQAAALQSGGQIRSNTEILGVQNAANNTGRDPTNYDVQTPLADPYDDYDNYDDHDDYGGDYDYYDRETPEEAYENGDTTEPPDDYEGDDDDSYDESAWHDDTGSYDGGGDYGGFGGDDFY